jgi:hypothetical protein
MVTTGSGPKARGASPWRIHWERTKSVTFLIRADETVLYSRAKAPPSAQHERQAAIQEILVTLEYSDIAPDEILGDDALVG